MLDFKFKVQPLKPVFFDRPRVRRAIGRAARAVLSRFGAFVRQRARTSIRRRKAVSAPGSPPSSHAGLLRAGIQFGYEPETMSVLIGPEPINRPTGAPRLLELGGVGTVEERDRKTGRRRTRKAIYRPRPYMLPAFNLELQKLPGYLAGSVRE